MQRLIGLVSIIFVSSMFAAQATAATYDYMASFEIDDWASNSTNPTVQVTGTFTWEETAAGGNLTVFDFVASGGETFSLWKDGGLGGHLTNTGPVNVGFENAFGFNVFSTEDTDNSLTIQVASRFKDQSTIGDEVDIISAQVNSSNEVFFGNVPNSGGVIKLTGCTQCDVSAVPIPAALPLFASAILGLGFFNRKRKNKLAVAV